MDLLFVRNNFNLLEKNLYKPDRESWKASLEYAKTLPPASNSNLVFHLFWRVPRPFERKQAAAIHSILAAHVDCLSQVEVNLWSNVDLSNNPYLKDIKHLIKFRLWDVQKEATGTPLEGNRWLKDLHDNNCWVEGDLFRLLVLYKYGGFYLDMDVLALRSLRPLNDWEFLYQWGTSGFNGHEGLMINGTAMKLNAFSPLATELLKLLNVVHPAKDGFNWGKDLYAQVKHNSLLVLPGMWFDSEWGFEGTTGIPFRVHTEMNLFDGAFIWHWHNRWDEQIQAGSKFAILEAKHLDILKQKNTI